MAEFEGKHGRWITTDTGRHIFIEDGKSVSEALGEFFEEFKYDPDDNFDADNGEELEFDEYKEEDLFKSKIDIETLKNKSENFDEYISKMLEEKEVYHEEVDNIVNIGINKIENISFKSSGDSGFSRMLNEIIYDLSGINGLPECRLHDLNTIAHELGHKVDSMMKGRYNSWYSSSYISPTHNKTLRTMIEEELRQIDPNKFYLEYGKKFRKQNNKLRENHISKRSWDGYTEEYMGLLNKYSDICDTLRAVFLNEIRTPNRCGCHSIEYFADYYIDRDENVGTEVFAEITANYFQQEKSEYIKFLEKYAPKTLEIYHEILEEVKKNHGNI